jgi:rhodanese-related sulfurtransferase
LGIEWASGMAMAHNTDFAQMLETEVLDKNITVLFLCRSGARSHHAATLAARQGYVKAFNILQGFEGDKNAAGQRRQLNGWVAAVLPWTQS